MNSSLTRIEYDETNGNDGRMLTSRETFVQKANDERAISDRITTLNRLYGIIRPTIVQSKRE